MSTKQHEAKPIETRYLNEKQVAEMLGISVRSLQGWRLRGKGPRYYKLSGDAVRYKISEVELWVESQASNPEAAA